MICPIYIPYRVPDGCKVKKVQNCKSIKIFPVKSTGKNYAFYGGFLTFNEGCFYQKIVFLQPHFL